MSEAAVTDRQGEDVVRPLSPGVTLASAYLEKMIRAALLVYIASLPFTALLVVERNGFLLLLGLLLLWCVMNRRLCYRRTPFDLPLASFVGWVGLTIPFAVFPDYSLKEFGKLLQQAVVFYAACYFLSPRSCRALLYAVVGGTLAIVSLKGIMQFDLDHPQSVMSFFSSEVWLTTFLVMTIPLAIATGFVAQNPWLRTAAFGTLGVAGITLVSTQSRAGLVSFVLEFWVTAWLVKTRPALRLAAVVSVGLMAGFLMTLGIRSGEVPPVLGDNQVRVPFQTTGHSIVHRFDIWAFSLAEIQKHWLVGIGYGKDNFVKVYGQETETLASGRAGVKKSGTHNMLLYLALHVGVPGMALFCWLYGRMIARTVRESRLARDWIEKAVLCGTAGGLAGVGLRLQFDQMLVGSLAVLFWVLLAMAVLHYPSWRQADSSSS